MRQIERLDPRAVAKVEGPAWEPLHGLFLDMASKLLAVSSESSSELTTIYVKFCTSSTKAVVYAVVWLRSSKEMVVGLSLPEDTSSRLLGPAPPKTTYKGLTKYFTLRPGDSLPEEFPTWVQRAFTHATTS